MPSFSQASMEKLAECDERLRLVAHSAIRTFDFKVLVGYRGEADQEEAFRNGASNAHFGQSAHNTQPSRAFDLAPFPIDFRDMPRYCRLGAAIFHAAQILGVKIFWGASISRPFDPGHFELRD